MRQDIKLLLFIFRTNLPIKRPNYDDNNIIIKDFQNQKLNFIAVSYEYMNMRLNEYVQNG